MFGRRSATDRGMPLGPTLTPSKPTPSQAAPICDTSMPASASPSSKASTIRLSPSASHRSPKRAQPMPRIATLSLMPLAMVLILLLFGRQGRYGRGAVVRHGLPEIFLVAADFVESRDAEHHPHGRADDHVIGLNVRIFDRHPSALVELDGAIVDRRIGRVAEAVGGVGENPRPEVGQGI